AKRRPGRGEEVQRAALGGLVAFLRRIVAANLALPSFPPEVRPLPGEVEQVAAPHPRNERPIAAFHRLQLETFLAQLVFGRHTILPRAGRSEGAARAARIIIAIRRRPCTTRPGVPGHPLRFSRPFRFAERSAQPKIATPTGMLISPIASSGTR